jgi:Asp-tRNA(Asn)/Glu-tRNA(Gln) amidotransferase A subunit family amidase
MYLQPPVMAVMEKDATYHRVQEAIRARFEPVAEEADADLMLTSPMVAKRVMEFSGKEFSMDMVHAMMEELGFLYVADEDLRFVWLLRERV